MLPRSVLKTFCLMLLAAPTAMPWGNEGHQLVARIAARKLTGNAPSNIILLLRSDKHDDLALKTIIGKTGDASSEALENALAAIAIWPDHIPGGKGPTAPWHFIDIGLFEDPSHIDERCVNGSCIVQKISDIVQNLKAGQSLKIPGTKTVFDPPKELRFLVHFLGDVHQPLHCATNADAGANCLKESGYDLQFPEVHEVWDTALVQEIIANGPADTAGAIIQEFDGNLTPAQASAREIAAESFAIANDLYKKTIPAIPVIDHFVDVTPSECDTKAPPEINAITVDARASYDNADSLLIVRQQLYKAGVRLAAILNSLYDRP